MYLTKEQVLARIHAGARIIWANAPNRAQIGTVLSWGEWGIEIATTLKTVPIKTVRWTCPILDIETRQ
jgi:hypothetical protein